MDQQKPSSPQETKLHFLDYWRIIRIRKTIILAVFFLVVLTATLVTFILPESFSSTARIRVERDISDIPGVGDRQMVATGYDPYFIQTEFEVLQSEVILGKVITDLNLSQEWAAKYGGGEKLKYSDTLEFLRKNMDVRPVRNTSIIEIRVFSDKSEEAAKIANAIAETYQSHRLSQLRDQTKNGIKALEEQWRGHVTQVDEAQADVDRKRTELKISDSDPMSTTPTPTLSMEAVRQLTTELIQMESDQVRTETMLSNLIALTPADQREAIQTTLQMPDSQLSNLQNELDLAQQRLLTVDRDYNKDHPLYKNAEKMVEALDSRIKDRVKGILLGLGNRADSGRAAIEVLKKKLEFAKDNDLKIAEHSRPYYTAKQRLSEYIQFRMILALKISQEQTELSLPRTTMVEIVDHGTKADRPEKPKKALNIALGVVIGLIVGVGLAFFIEYLDTSVKTIDDVERTLQSAVLGVIPQNVGLLMEEGAESPHAEAYRVLRTNLLFSRKDTNLNSIAIVSAGAGEGKSTTVFNLATIFAQNGSRVVIVDSDLRRPVLHKMLHVTNNIGMTNYLLKQNTLEEVIQTTSLPTMDFMASGKLPSSSLGILSSTQMRDLINELKQRYDFVFFDSPPIMGVSDASILASVVDMTLQVIQYRRYPQPMNIRAKQMIEKVGGNLVGIVLNNINMSQDENYYYYSGYYHEYYSKNEDSQPAAAPGEGDAGNQKTDIKPKY
jgi:capsular exopolysaccharide synthesis family protein